MLERLLPELLVGHGSAAANEPRGSHRRPMAGFHEANGGSWMLRNAVDPHGVVLPPRRRNSSRAACEAPQPGSFLRASCALEPTAGQIRHQHLVLVVERIEQLADRLVEDGMLELRC